MDETLLETTSDAVGSVSQSLDEDRAHASAASGDADLPVADRLIAPRDYAQSLPELLHPILGALARSLVLHRESSVEGRLKRLLLD